MARPASHSHSNGALGTTQICRPSTKKITADAASGGSRVALSVVGPLRYASSSGALIVNCAAAGGVCADMEIAADATAMTTNSRRPDGNVIAQTVTSAIP